METIINILHLIIPTAIGLVIYYWSSTFKKLGSMSQNELNEDDENEQDKVNPNEAKGINYFGTSVFVLIGIGVWLILGITTGRIASLIAPNNFLRWIVYILIYFIFLRFPFGVGNKMVKRSYSFERFPEKIIFSFTMICAYVFAICCFESIPSFLKWQFYFLN